MELCIWQTRCCRTTTQQVQVHHENHIPAVEQHDSNIKKTFRCMHASNVATVLPWQGSKHRACWTPDQLLTASRVVDTLTPSGGSQQGTSLPVHRPRNNGAPVLALSFHHPTSLGLTLRLVFVCLPCFFVYYVSSLCIHLRLTDPGGLGDPPHGLWNGP